MIVGTPGDDTGFAQCAVAPEQRHHVRSVELNDPQSDLFVKGFSKIMDQQTELVFARIEIDEGSGAAIWCSAPADR